jgi:peptide/nickel transport system substrate-binding protein
MRYFKASIGRHSSVLVLRFVVLLVAFALFAAACGDDGDDEEATPAAPAATAPAAAPTTAPVAVPTLAQATAAPVVMRDSVTVVMSGGLSPLENLDTTIAGLRFTVPANVYDPLTRYNAQDTEFEPKLATSWERINDNTIRFSLRPNVKFHSGSAFAADDVKFHIDRIKDPDVGSPSNFWYAPVEEVKIVDNLTVDFVGESYGMLNVANVLTPVDKETFDQIGADAYSQQGIGTGPFKVVQWEIDDFIDLEANPDYWDGAPQINTLKFHWISEAATKVAMLYAGEADHIDLVPAHLAAQIERQPQLDVREAGSQRAIFLTVNTFEKPFDDVRVRQAMAYAINLEEIVDALYAGKAEPLATTGANTIEYFNDGIKPYPYDPDKAKELLAAAGYPDGFETSLDSPSGWFFLDKETGQVVVEQLGKVGIKAEFWSAEIGTFWDKWVNKGSALAYMACGNVRGDMPFCYRLHYHSQARGIYYNSPEVEALIDGVYSASDPAEQKRLAFELQQFVHDNVPYIPLYQANQIFGVNSDLNWEPDGDERYYFHKASWKAK